MMLKKPPDVRYRNGVRDDVQRIAFVNIETWRTSFAGIVPQAFLDSMSMSQRAQGLVKRFDKQNYGVVVAEHENDIVGYCDVGAPRNSTWPYSAELYSIYVLKDFQRAGIGKALFVRAAEFLSNIGQSSVFLRVLAVNPHYGFYEKMGGKLVDREPTEIAGQSFDHLVYAWDELGTITAQ